MAAVPVARPVARAVELSPEARALRVLHSSVALAEVACLGYLWFCAVTRRRDAWLLVAASALIGEGVALLAAKGCPLGTYQRRAGDEVPMFELWLGPSLAPYAVPALTATTIGGLALLFLGREGPANVTALCEGPDDEDGRAMARKQQHRPT